MILPAAVISKSFIGDINAVINQSFMWLGRVIGAVSNSPILTLLVVAVPLVGIGITLFKKALA